MSGPLRMERERPAYPEAPKKADGSNATKSVGLEMQKMCLHTKLKLVIPQELRKRLAVLVLKALNGRGKRVARSLTGRNVVRS
ncbi:hypothetical protein GCM10007094_02170 [Pseudovibrio japonicus]|uniref:Uncharacterized protein n=1 Tax=Pseudovibrio japonicus TaxID=366534 RepID=A0ABQ3DVZ4_9HYPH|nr:hypothetical protein GCM10007094_02170 [Pseudovibrio japonicus]